jgi:hypothetical protein
MARCLNRWDAKVWDNQADVFAGISNTNDLLDARRAPYDDLRMH